MNKLSKTLFLINPKSNDNKAGNFWKKIQKKNPILPVNPIDVTSVNLDKIIAKKKPETIVIAGGDGTINSVCNAVYKMKKKPVLSIIPLGFGNALSYCLGVETIDKALDVLKTQPARITIDMMRTNTKDHQIGVFNISVGLSARILLQRQSYRYIGFGSYIVSTLQSLFSHPENQITFTIDHKTTLSATAAQLVISNCPVIGLNYVASPNAKLNDGFLDCTLFSTKYASLTSLRLQGFKHPLYSELGKVRFKAKHIKIEGEPMVQIDGDPLVQKEGIEIGILPSQLTFLRNTDENINQEYLPFIL